MEGNGLEFVHTRAEKDVELMRTDSPQMTARDVIDFVRLLMEHDIPVVLDGGWGVDAALGRQTRLHADLDIAIQHSDSPRLRALLEERGYREVPRDDSWACNFVLGDAHGHLIDVHSCTHDEAGNLIYGVPYPIESLGGSGTVAGLAVRCITPEWLVKFHTGYPLDENDYRDVQALCAQFGIPLPEEFRRFEQTDGARPD